MLIACAKHFIEFKIRFKRTLGCDERGASFFGYKIGFACVGTFHWYCFTNVVRLQRLLFRAGV